MVHLTTVHTVKRFTTKVKIAWSAPGLQAAVLWQTLLLALILIAKDLPDEQVVFIYSI